MKSLWNVFAPLAVSALLVSPVWAADTIKLGVPGAHSGDLASYGLPSLNAAQLVVDEYNAKGGVLGKQIEILAEDEQCKPELATNVATKLLSDGVDVLMGHICSGATKAALPIYTDAKKIIISPSATTPPLTLSGENPYFLRTIANDQAQGQFAAKFIGDLGKKKVAILHDNADYGKGYAETVKMFLEKDGKVEVVLFEALNPDAVDFSASVRKLRRTGADMLVFGGYHPTASKLIQQVRRDRISIPLLGPDGLKDPSMIAMAGTSAEGMYASQPQDTSKLSLYAKARQQHLDKFGNEPGAFFYNAYAATQALLNAIEQAGTAEDSDKILEALRTKAVDTPLGPMLFNQQGDATGIGLSMYQVQNGAFVELTDSRMMLE